METKNNPKKSSKRNEIAAILLVALGLLLFVCLLTFHPNDSSWNVSSRTDLQNWVGSVGSNFAQLIFQCIGLTAFLLPIICLLAAWRFFRPGVGESLISRAIGVLLLIVTFSTLFSVLNFPSFYDSSFVSGGFIGELISRFVMSGLGRAGTAILMFALLAMSFLMATNFSFASVFSGLSFVFAPITGFFQEQFYEFQDWREQELEKARLRQKRRRARVNEVDEEIPVQSKTAVLEEETPGFWGNLTSNVSNFLQRLKQPPDFVNDEFDEDEDESVEKIKVTKPNKIETDKEVKKEIEAIEIPTAETVEPKIITEENVAEREEIEPITVTRKEEDDEEFSSEILLEPEEVKEAEPAKTSKKPKAQDFQNYALPSTDFLSTPSAKILHADEQLLEIAQQVVEKCKEFNVTGRVMHICQGPVVTTYEYKPDPGVKYASVTKLNDDLCLALKAESIRIDRIPGKAYVGIEVPNPQRETIFLREVIESKKFRESSSLLTVALGKTIDGLNYVADLSKMPHLLIAGATGSGKSVGVNTLIVSLLYRARPDEVKFIMVDPKRVELGIYGDIPHLATPIITDPKRAATSLKWAVSEMERRYKELAGWGVRNIDGFNAEVQRRNFIQHYDDNGQPWKKLPYIVIIIDEFADLMMVSKSDVEESVTRLAQMARAVGIHLILATQRPSTDVITGIIKANFPSRIAFRVSSTYDSRTIIDGNGAEQLLGRGDMLFLPPGSSRLIRVHGAYVDETEINKIVAYVKEQGVPDYDISITQTEEETDAGGVLPGRNDDLFWDALRFIAQNKKASTSLLQRHLRIGYGRAAAILDAMAYEGFIGEQEGATRARPVTEKGYQALADFDEQQQSGGFY
jgi:S-DNA-T family DNA segregation ATPase FtsK/SpoIIIE